MKRRLLVIGLVVALLAVTPLTTLGQDETPLETYTVQAGDNLFRIALRYNTSTEAIATENNITDVTRIVTGQQLRIPGTTADDADEDNADDTGTETPTDTYIVQRGDTLGSIARRFGTTFTAIAQANNLANPNLILVGQQLTIPGATIPDDSDTDTGNQPDGGDDPGTGGDVYTVNRGDTLNSIARRFGVSSTAIAQANGITNPNLIFPGQQLTIPGATIVDGGGTPPPSSGSNVGGGFELGGQVVSFAYPDLMRGTGMTWIKTQVRYNQGDPASIAQPFIDSANERGFKVLLSVIGDKGQLAANPTQYYQDFATFLGDVAALNPDGIEVWNEMNIDREWPSGLISGQQYTQMLSAAYQSIKSRNPNVLVISGAPAPTGFFGGCTTAGCDDNFFIRDMANAGAAQFMDCVGIHYNEGIVPPTQNSGDPRGNSSHYSRYYNGMVSLYSSTFPNKPLCFTEIGYLSADGYDPLPSGFTWAADTTVQQQAQWLADAARLAQNSGRVRLFIVWNVDATQYGEDPQAGYAIVRPDGTCPACNTLAAAVN
jgi:LysM repeat protein